MELLAKAWDIVIHLDTYLTGWASEYGPWFYAIMFAVVFAETGLVIMPFLPGDSLLFALGILAAQADSSVNPWIMGSLLMVAALCGDNLNYWVGRRIGPRIFTSSTSRLLNKNHLLKAQKFYEKHGPKTIVLARFIAIVRTFAPFVAGIGQMNYGRFLSYSVFGAAVWVWSFILTGYWLGTQPVVKDNFSVIVWAIMAFTIVLGVVEAIKAKRAKSQAATTPDAPPPEDAAK